MKLAIISHTPHYKINGKVAGWGATVREINHLTGLFDEIIHLAPLHEGEAPASTQEYTSDKIKFIELKPYGGEKLTDKLTILTTAFYNLKKIKSVLNKVDWVQFRAPTSMGLYVLPYLSMRKKPSRWVKYAGNWNMESAPMSYRFQKWWLEKNFQSSKVTINGQWEFQKEHILNFQNPCLDNEELERAKQITERKEFEGKLVFCFAGTLTKNKGIDIILGTLREIKSKDEIEEIILVGDGPDRKKYEEEASQYDIKISFRGFLNRKQLESIYEKSHFILLPSESEGFPKVIAEASAYGCIPVVSDVSSIGQYYDDSNSFLLRKIDSEELAAKINFILNNRSGLKEMSVKSASVAELFTFENYMKNLKEKILSE